MQRTLQPELLDHLAPHSAEARGSRRDLRLINTVMGNERWLHRTLRKWTQLGDRMLELGGGDGRFAESWAGPRLDVMDLHPAPAGWHGEGRWHRAEVCKFRDWERYDVVFGNLFFHHLSDDALRHVGKELRQHARVIVACEPLRGRLYQWLFAGLCPLIGANGVTRHDGRVSIRAGFRDDELPRSLGLREDGRWQCRVGHTLTGAYHLVAVKT